MDADDNRQASSKHAANQDITLVSTWNIRLRRPRMRAGAILLSYKAMATDTNATRRRRSCGLQNEGKAVSLNLKPTPLKADFT